MFEYGDTIQLIVALLMLHLPLSSALSLRRDDGSLYIALCSVKKYKIKNVLMYTKGRMNEREITSLSCEYQFIITRFNINCVVHIHIGKKKNNVSTQKNVIDMTI